MNKNLHSSGTKWLPIMTCICTPLMLEVFRECCIFCFHIFFSAIFLLDFELFRQSGILCFSFYFFDLSIRFWTELFRQCERPSWLWSYASWIYNYLCNQCLSPLMLWFRISIRARCITLCDKVCQWLAAPVRYQRPWSSAQQTFAFDDVSKSIVSLSISKKDDDLQVNNERNKTQTNVLKFGDHCFS